MRLLDGRRPLHVRQHILALHQRSPNRCHAVAGLRQHGGLLGFPTRPRFRVRREDRHPEQQNNDLLRLQPLHGAAAQPLSDTGLPAPRCPRCIAIRASGARLWRCRCHTRAMSAHQLPFQPASVCQHRLPERRRPGWQLFVPTGNAQGGEGSINLDNAQGGEDYIYLDSRSRP